MIKHFINTMINVGPLHVVWLIYSGIGSLAFGVFSIPSHGLAVVLIPLFISAGLILLLAVPVSRRGNLLKARTIASVGLAILTISAWGRGLALLGLDQQGNGSPILASLVWSWLCVGFSLMLVSVRVRGVRYE